MSKTVYDVIVVGGGPIGLATAYEVAKSNHSVMVLEQNNFFNQAGSSGDLMRMYRTMYTEDFMAKLAKTSLGIWAELESDAGVSLRAMTGLLNFGDPEVGKESPEGTLEGPIKNLKDLNMPFTEYQTPAEIEKKWPFKNLPSFYKGVFAPDNGIINVPLLLRTLSRLAKDYGAHTRQQVKVDTLAPSDSDKDIWDVHTTAANGKSDCYKARKIVITTGAYSNQVLEKSFGLKLNLEIWEMTANYFNVNAGPNGTVFPSMWFQFAKNVPVPDTTKTRSRLFYGFPAVEWGPQNVARISVDAATNIIEDPSQRRSNVINPEDIADTQEFVRDHVVGVDSTVPAFSLTCLQTNVYDNMFVLDYIPPEYLTGGAPKSVMIFTAGWAMKFVPLLGRALKEMALDGDSEYKLENFSINRNATDKDGKYHSIIHDAEKQVNGLLSRVEGREQASGSSYPFQRVRLEGY